MKKFYIIKITRRSIYSISAKFVDSDAEANQITVREFKPHITQLFGEFGSSDRCCRRASDALANLRRQ